ncbi:MAG: hypothetical protein LBH85_00710 [Treponema sp.]|jgi:hypothetical protein|nr:hypothetical protein [Treponema sp.]
MIKWRSLFVCVILFVFQGFQIFAEAVSDVVVEYIKTQSAARDAAITPEMEGRVAVIGGGSQ